MNGLNSLEKRILDMIQQDIPLVEQPFRVMAQETGTDEDTFLLTVRDLLERGLIRDISAIFNARGLGYKSTLVAVASETPDDTARIISRHPGVSHNYYREHEFNIWFTLTIPEDRDLDSEIRTILAEGNYSKYRILPALRTFKIGVNFRFSGEGQKKSGGQYRAEVEKLPVHRELVLRLQEPFPLVSSPWSEIASELGRDESEILGEIEAMKKAGIIKRISGVVRHRKTGFSANGMACFKVSTEHCEEAGRKAAQYSAVSHCYERPVFPDWPYSLFAMTHGKSEEECRTVIDEIASEIGAEDTLILYSTKEYKKERVKYYV